MPEWSISVWVTIGAPIVWFILLGPNDGSQSAKDLLLALILGLLVPALVAIPILAFNGLLAWLGLNPYYEEILDCLSWVPGVLALVTFLFFWAAMCGDRGTD